jgi:UDP-glucose:(heptosyl)LPS alpha-1,3-glucosyltransferase
LRIAFLVDRFGRRYGGAEAYSVDLVAHLLTRDHDVTVIAHEFDHQLPIREVRILGPRWWPSWLRVWHFAMRAKQLTAQGFDIVHSNMDGPAGQIQVMHVSPVRFRRLRGRSKWAQVLQWLSPRNAVYFWLEASRMVRQVGRQIVAVAPVIKVQLLQAYGQDLNVTVIPPGVDQVPVNHAARDKTRADLGIDVGDIVCLLVALNPIRKGLLTLLQAVNDLPAHYKILVVGAEIELQDSLRRHALALGGRLLFVRPTAVVSPYYFAADLYVHPTLGDSFAMAPLEAMAHGLPVVLSDARYCGFAQYVTHGFDAWVLEQPDKPDEISRAIRELMTSPSVRLGLIHNSAQLVDRLSWDKVTDQYETLYNQALNPAAQPIPQ